MSQADWIDISVMLRGGMPNWPGDPPVVIERVMDMHAGDVCTVSRLDLSAHTGTHMDAPAHYLRDGRTLDTMPLGATVGPARVVEVQDPESIKVADIDACDPQPGERILFKTPNSARVWQANEFVKDFVYISQEAARALGERRVQMVGIDYLSIGGFFKDGVETHEAILGAGIWVIEGLNLSQVTPGSYELVCLPLKIFESDGAPARAILRPL